MQIRSSFLLAASLLLQFTASAAELVRIGDASPAIPASIGLEANRGQSQNDVLFLHRTLQGNFAVTPQSVVYSPLKTQLNLIESNSSSFITYSSSTPGTVNVYRGNDPTKWLTGIPVYEWARLDEIYTGIQLTYAPKAEGSLVLRWTIQPGARPDLIKLELPNVLTLQIASEGQLLAQFEGLTLGPQLKFAKPVGYQKNGEQATNQNVDFKLISPTRFGFHVDTYNASEPLEIELTLSNPVGGYTQTTEIDPNKNLYVAEELPDAAGLSSPFSGQTIGGCGQRQFSPIACTDVALTKYSAQGKLIFRSYLSGSYREVIHSLGLSKDGKIAVSGTVESPDFPVSANAYQKTHAGPSPKYGWNIPGLRGDAFAATLDQANGHLIQSTFLGGPNEDQLNRVSLGEDDSFYLISHQATDQLPIAGGSLQTTCPDPCRNGYVAKLNEDLTALTFSTYLPGTTSKSYLHADGSLYFAGFSAPGFPTTPDAYQRTVPETKGFIARLQPNGAGLTFGTYYAKSSSDGIWDLAVTQDGSVWALAAIQNATIGGAPEHQNLIRVSADGTKLLHEAEIDSSTSLSVDKSGNLFSVSPLGSITASPNSLLSQSCSAGAFIKRNSSGEQTFATYLPAHYTFAGINENNELLLRNEKDGLFRLDEKLVGLSPYAGCIADAAQFSADRQLSPGEIVTIFGKNLGPVEGASFELENNKLPTQIAGTQVLINGQPAPLLYVSATQVNFILPYSLEVKSTPKIQVVVPPTTLARGTGNEISRYQVIPSEINIFQVGGQPSLAAALNQDGSVNTPENPAKRGESIVLFGTGGGQTSPASIAGEVTPLALVPLVENVAGRINGFLLTRQLEVQYAGGAPGLVSGVNQINVRIPADLPDSMTRDGVLPLTFSTPGSTPATIYIAVK